MGSYDILQFRCPHCRAVQSFQSKAGECAMKSYKLTTAPLAILADFTSRATKCSICGKQVKPYAVTRPEIAFEEAEDVDTDWILSDGESYA